MIYNHFENDLKHLKNIKNIEFTVREIDILACILTGKAAGVIGTFLNIPIRTVESRMLKIREKIGKNSRSGIIEFLEQSGKKALLGTHYQNLQIEKAFLNALDAISKLKTNEDVEAVLLYRNDLHPIYEALKDYLKIAGISLKIRKLRQEKIGEVEQEYKFDGKIQRLSNKNSPFAYIFCKTDSMVTPTNHVTLDFTNAQNSYFNAIKLLKILLEPLSLDSIESAFQDEYNIIKPSDPDVIIIESIDYFKILLDFLKQKKLRAGLIAFSFLLFGGVSYSFIANYNTEKKEVIRSDLIIPDSNFLKRNNVINLMKQKLNNQEGIKRIALVGIGGIGKTTLARYFGRKQNSSLVWEINAETEESLISSFNSLAYTLATTTKEKETLQFIKTIQDPAEIKKQLIQFIKTYLRNHPEWLLIYDNLESLDLIKNYLPSDPKVWGEGQVIITTQNTGIQNTDYINAEEVIELNKLTDAEGLKLFSKILYGHKPSELSPEQRTKTIAFLKELPSFPLDISVAAYYIKDSHISYEQYLVEVGQSIRNLDAAQKNILKTITDYEKTRYGIISTSFKKLIEANPEFKDMLLFICLLDSQNIPRNLLEAYKDPKIVDSFMHTLRKYSLVTSESLIGDKEKIHAFSLHRATQVLGRSFLLSTLTSPQKENKLELMIEKLTFYLENRLSLDDFIKKQYDYLDYLLPHLEEMKKNINDTILTKKALDQIQQNLSLTIGNIYYEYYRYHKKAQEYLYEAYKLHQKYNNIPPNQLIKLLMRLGHCYSSLGNFDLAKKYAQESIDLCKTTPTVENRAELLAVSYETVALAYQAMNNFKDAQDYFSRSLKILNNQESLWARGIKTAMYARLASLYNETCKKEDRTKAHEYIKKAIGNRKAESKIDLETPWQSIIHHITLGEIYNQDTNYEKAMEEGFKAAEYMMKHITTNYPQKIVRANLEEGLGELYLRTNNLNKAEESLTQCIETYEEQQGVYKTINPTILRAECYIRLGKLAEAYKDCETTFKIERRRSSNYHNLRYLNVHYHAAFIKYQQNDLIKSMEHFADFFKGIQEFCKGFLDEKSYQELEHKSAFKIYTYNAPHAKEIITIYLKNSADIFTAIYWPNHPFVQDYIIKNYDDAIKPWYKFF